MEGLKSIKIGKHNIYFEGDKEEEDFRGLLEELCRAKVTIEKGRAGIKVFNFKGFNIACRQYVHGGLLRVVTRDLFFSAKRAIHEMEMLLYLRNLNIPVVKPLCIIEEETHIFRKLFILTYFEDGAKNLPEYLQYADKRHRIRIFKKMANLFRMLENASVYHPDLHLDNILVKVKSLPSDLIDSELILVDFDKARFKYLTKEVVEDMLWRINRYAEKLEKKGTLRIDFKEKLLFLKTYERLSGNEIINSMKNKYRYKKILSRIGWKLEKLLYGT